MSTLTTYNPFREFDALTNRLFGQSAAPARGGESRPWLPQADVTEDETAYTITTDLPEVPKDAVKVTVEDGVLTIRGERKWEKKTDNTKVHLVERSYGSFTRSFRLPDDAAGDKVSASFKEGVLKVVLPKREETKPRQVEVQVH
ncbi:MAG: Hsp20/alpha crystallin family protein [Verrucomicrobiales bacterium]